MNYSPKEPDNLGEILASICAQLWSQLSFKMPDTFYAPGIPARVTDYANIYKKKFEENATTAELSPRKESKNDLPVLPPGIDRKRFNEAIIELKSIIDGEVVLVDETLDDGWYLNRPLTHDAFPLDAQDEFVNSAICSPANVEQVQDVVKWANKWLIPIYPISMGRNLGNQQISF